MISYRSIRIMTVIQFGACITKLILPSVLSVDPPKITKYPESQLIPAGAEATFSVKAAGDNLAYQWQKNGSKVCNDSRHKGADTNTLTIEQVNKSDAGCYKCVVKNEVKRNGEVSEEAQLNVCEFSNIVCILS